MQQEYKPKEETKLIHSGPVFEAGPGWGKKVKIWFKKYFYKVFLPIVIVLLFIYALTTRQKVETSVNLSPFPTPDSISQKVQRGDSRTLIAREALSKYLQASTDEILSTGQKIFIENKLSQLIPATILKTGLIIDIKISDIRSLIDQSKQLSKSQLEKWAQFTPKTGIK